MATHADPMRGDVWFVNLNPTLGREFKEDHMCVVVSDDVLMEKAELVIVVPITSHPARVRCHVPLDPKVDKIDMGPLEGSVLCDQVRSVSTLKHKPPEEGRFRRYAGTVSPGTMQEIEDSLRDLLSL